MDVVVGSLAQLLTKALLDGVVEALGSSAEDSLLKINKAVEEMRGFLNDADWRRNSEEEVEGWVRSARHLAYGVEDLLDGYNLQRGRGAIRNPKCFTPAEAFVHWLFSRRLCKIAGQAHDISERMLRFGFELTEVGQGERRRQSGTSAISFSPAADTVGMDADAEKVEAWLVGDTQQEAVIVVAGAMGTGKTTLAARVYEATKNQFDCHAWAFLSQPFNKKDALREILKGLYESSSKSAVIGAEEEMDEEALGRQIRGYLRRKKYMLVLDDVRDRQSWSELSRALPPDGAVGWKVLLTTRDNKLAEGSSHVLLTLTGLSPEESMTLLIKRAFANDDDVTECPPDLRPAAEVILNKCERLPISIVTVAGLLSSKNPTPEEWGKVAAQLDRHQTGQDVFVTSGYTDLSPELKRCFLYCSIFPENYSIPRKKLVRLLVAEGFHNDVPGSTKEEVTERQLNRLIERNMLQVARRGLDGEVESYRILRLMRGFSLHMSGRDDFCQVEGPGGGGGPAEWDWKELRRLSTHNTATISSEVLQRSTRLRSLLLFHGNGSQGIPPRPLNLWPLKLLRVLELRGLAIKGVPVAVASLALLRYLGLRGTRIAQLPWSLHRLVELETLDIRQTKVRWVPDLFFLGKLRHLYMGGGSFFDRVVTSNGIFMLTELQTLTGAKATKRLSEELGCLANLRKLSIGKAMTEDSSMLSTSINKMTLLASLTIRCEWGQRFHMGGLTHHTHLNKLKLGGRMDGLLNWVSGLTSLAYLYLWDTRLTQDPLHELQHLNKLVLLSLCDAYDGTHVSCDGDGFPGLKKLSIIHARELESGCFAEGAMPQLETMFIGYCPKLPGLPDGIENLMSLKMIQLSVMSSVCVENAREKSHEETRFKVRIIPQLLTSNINAT